jgi:hypothetical protein|tara:strand:- start:1517 stop:1636 length:120 start_codon:yes stop_codon:yes gene_type:complete
MRALKFCEPCLRCDNSRFSFSRLPLNIIHLFFAALIAVR